MNSSSPEAWMAMLHLRPVPGSDGGLSGSAGAYAWVLALASSEDEYREMVAAEMNALGLFIAEIDQLDRFSEFHHSESTIEECAANLSAEWPVQYHTFDCYPHDEA
jgi:hypothetical protein